MSVGHLRLLLKTLKTQSSSTTYIPLFLAKEHLSVSYSDRFGYITPNEWDTFIKQYTTIEVIALSNKMEELNAKNKSKHKLRPGGYKVAMPKWAKKEQELCDAGIPDPLEGYTVCTRNWIRGHSCTYDSGRLITSSSEVTSVVQKAKTLTAKEKTSKFKSQRERDQLSAAFENEEHHGHT
jgi:hypothetical protein